MIDMYDDALHRIMKAADTVSAFSENRVEQIRTFAVEAGYSRIGIAHCITFSTETRILEEYFSGDFEVHTVDCKYGRLTRKELFGHGSGILCNPAGQARYLNDCCTDLNISIGLCVGHDMVFNAASEAPVTGLFIKDFTNNNNSARAVSEVARQRRC